MAEPGRPICSKNHNRRMKIRKSVFSAPWLLRRLLDVCHESLSGRRARPLAAGTKLWYCFICSPLAGQELTKLVRTYAICIPHPAVSLLPTQIALLQYQKVSQVMPVPWSSHFQHFYFPYHTCCIVPHV